MNNAERDFFSAVWNRKYTQKANVDLSSILPINTSLHWMTETMYSVHECDGFFYEMETRRHRNLVVFYPFLRTPGNIHSNAKGRRQNQKHGYKHEVNNTVGLLIKS